MVANNKKLLSKKDLVKSWMLWLGTCELSNSCERLQSLSFAACLSPILKKLYKSDQLSAALKLHLTFFNTEGIWGSIIPGVVLPMEEEKAQGAEITDKMITGLKTGMMCPLAGIGDTVDWSTANCRGFIFAAGFCGKLISWYWTIYHLQYDFHGYLVSTCGILVTVLVNAVLYKF